MGSQTEFLARLDRLARPAVVVAGRVRSPFRLCGGAGLVAAVGLGAGLTLHLGLSVRVLGLLTVAAILMFLSLAMAAKMVAGDERLVYYHHQATILGAATVMLWATHQPVLAYLDVTILGVGTFLAFGRLGCFMVGCCHGRPHRWGVCYGEGHADAGLAPYLVGVRLFPIQLVESAWVLVVVAVAIVGVVQGGSPGEALATYLVAYAAGRFGFEFLRGDPGRPHLAGFSEAQWISLLFPLTVVLAGRWSTIPVARWHVVTTGGLAVTAVAVALRRHRAPDARHRLLHPAHVQEVAWALELLPGMARSRAHAAGPATFVSTFHTTAGLRLSTCDAVPADGSHVGHYVVSSTNSPLQEADARTVADLLALLAHLDTPVDVRPFGPGAYHLAVRAPEPREAVPAARTGAG